MAFLNWFGGGDKSSSSTDESDNRITSNAEIKSGDHNVAAGHGSTITVNNAITEGLLDTFLSGVQGSYESLGDFYTYALKQNSQTMASVSEQIQSAYSDARDTGASKMIELRKYAPWVLGALAIIFWGMKRK